MEKGFRTLIALLVLMIGAMFEWSYRITSDSYFGLPLYTIFLMAMYSPLLIFILIYTSRVTALDSLYFRGKPSRRKLLLKNDCNVFGVSGVKRWTGIAVGLGFLMVISAVEFSYTPFYVLETPREDLQVAHLLIMIATHYFVIAYAETMVFQIIGVRMLMIELYKLQVDARGKKPEDIEGGFMEWKFRKVGSYFVTFLIASTLMGILFFVMHLVSYSIMYPTFNVLTVFVKTILAHYIFCFIAFMWGSSASTDLHGINNTIAILGG